MKYEGIFITDPDRGGDAGKKVVAAIQEVITKNDGTIGEVQEWGRRKLGHPILAKRDGYYTWIQFELQSEKMDRVQSLLRLNDDVWKFMVTSHQEPKKLKVRVRKPKSAEAKAN